ASRRSPSENRRIARQDCELTLRELYECARRNLGGGGRMFFVIPAMREQEARSEAARSGFQIERIEADPAIRQRSGGIRLISAVKQELF
ncbi:MAG: hypothetical protein JXR73_17895, partial [Candidatus Omnitrophica bacterium]|nr:hypothetical protein [Candidatus Omnitrophota bacterium]